MIAIYTGNNAHKCSWNVPKCMWLTQRMYVFEMDSVEVGLILLVDVYETNVEMWPN